MSKLLGDEGFEFDICTGDTGEDNGVALIKKKSSDFRGENLCITKRDMEDIKMESGKNNIYDNAIAVKAAIDGIFKGEVEKNESDVRDLIDQVLTDEAPTLKTDELRRELLTQNILRYARCETRKPLVLDPERKDIIKEEYQISVKPDKIFGKQNAQGYSELEAVLYKAGYPTVTQNGNKRDKSVELCTELYLLLEYLKTMVPAGTSCTLKASYYFMRKSSDGGPHRDNDFFNGTNVVTLEDVYCNDGSGTKTDVERKLDQMIEEYAVGRECDGEECENCMYNCMCNYIASPETLEKKEVRKKEKVQYTAAQEAVINAKEGVLRVIAGAGAGKTECVSERFARLVLDMIKEA